MNAPDKPDAKDSAQQDGYGYPGEISLVDLAISLWRHKWLIIGVFGICTIAGAAYTALREAHYEYSTTIELGTRIVGEDFRVIEDPKNVIAKLEHNYIPEAIRIFQRDLKSAGKDNIGVRVEAANPRDTELIVLSSRGTDELRDVYISLHEHILERLIEDHANILELERVRMERELEDARIQLEELEDERVLQVERKRMENQIAEARNKLAELVDHEALLKQELENLEVQETLVSKRLEELATFIVQARSRRTDTVGEVLTGADGMAMMLMDNELQRDIDRQIELEERLLVQIPESRSTLRSQLEENQRNQMLQREEVVALEGQLEKLLLDQERNLARFLPVYNELQTRLANQRETRAVLPPRQSLRPINLSGTITIGLSMILGILLALFAAGLAVLVKSARARLAQEQSGASR